jgi:DNA-directed RNA polymerase subunit RPC12/RpoP
MKNMQNSMEMILEDKKYTMNIVTLKTFDNYFFANITYTKLQDAGIECFLRDQNTVLADPLLSNAIGGIKLEVAEDDFELATELMRGAEQAYLDDIVCPYCNTAGLNAEEKINKPETFWGKLKNQIAYGQTETYSKKYRCQHCKSLMNELPASF